MHGDTVDHVNEHSNYPQSNPWAAIGPRLSDFAPLSIQQMSFPGDAYDRGRIRPGMPRRADWLDAAPDGCRVGYREHMAFEGYRADVVSGADSAM